MKAKEERWFKNRNVKAKKTPKYEEKNKSRVSVFVRVYVPVSMRTSVSESARVLFPCHHLPSPLPKENQRNIINFYNKYNILKTISETCLCILTQTEKSFPCNLSRNNNKIIILISILAIYYHC